MCGRYYRKSDKQKIADAFHVKHVEDFPLPPWDYNVAPTTMQPVIRNNRDTGERELVSLRWGLLPFWAKDLQSFKGISTINARAENITASRTYREPLKRGRRCLIPTSGFYEWKRVGGKTAPKNLISTSPLLAFRTSIRYWPLNPVVNGSHSPDGATRIDSSVSPAMDSLRHGEA
jgi:putative SOS response-associated peptidase YedK